MITIIIPTYNRKELLKRCIDSIRESASAGIAYEMIVVDDASSDGTDVFLKQKSERSGDLRYFIQQHKGPAAARNKGAEMARGKILVFTDDDCIIRRNWLSAVQRGFEDPGTIAGEGPVVSGIEKEKPHPLNHAIDNQKPGGYLSCNLAVRKQVFVSLGGFDERFHRAAHEDMDLCLRILKAGEIKYLPNMEIHHPPVRRNGRREIIRAWGFCRDFLKSEYLLYIKNKESYPKVRYRKTYYQTMLHHCIKYVYLYSRCPVSGIIGHPVAYMNLVVINVLRMIFMSFWFIVSLIKGNRFVEGMES